MLQTVIKDFQCSATNRFSLQQVEAEFQFLHCHHLEANTALREFAKQAPLRERQCHELLQSIPGVGFVAAEVVLAKLADIDRFPSQKDVVAYAGLAPGQRESAGKAKELHIEKTALDSPCSPTAGVSPGASDGD